MAEQTRTKTEMPHKRCLGIVLLADEHGYPMRWKVVGGKTKDANAMSGLLEDIGKVKWLGQTPTVFDRAMGNQKTVAKLKATEAIRFLTAAHVTAIESYTKDIPVSVIDKVTIKGTDQSYEQDIKRVAKAARGAKFEEIHERLFAIDLGVAVPASEQQKAEDKPALRRGRRVLAVKHLRQAYTVQKMIKADPTLKRKEIAASLGITINHLRNQLSLLGLSPAVQERIMQLGERFPCGEKYLRSLLSLAPDEQLITLDKKIVDQMSVSSAPKESKDDKDSIGLLRFVAYFNPQLFVDIRRRTASHCEKLQGHMEKFNTELRAAKRSRDYNATYRKFSYEVERLNYLDTFDIELTPITVTSQTRRPIASFQGSIIRKEKVWKRRRRYDGFVLLLGHPELSHSARQLVQFYRIKDAVEKDFQTMKSVIKLRPIYSYTDPKVQAHVTLCMLSLLLQRTLERRLRDAQLSLTTPACINALKTCHLNEHRADDEPLYDITQVNSAQREILAALGLEHLADDEYLRSRITARRSGSPQLNEKQGRRVPYRSQS